MQVVILDEMWRDTLVRNDSRVGSGGGVMTGSRGGVTAATGGGVTAGSGGGVTAGSGDGFTAGSGSGVTAGSGGGVTAGSGGGVTAGSGGGVTEGWAILGGGGGRGGVTEANTLCSSLATSLYSKSTNTVSTPLHVAGYSRVPSFSSH